LAGRTAEQLWTHPLRRAIFETWVVSEVMKHRLNAGEPGSVYPYRDQNQVETDLIVDRGDRPTLSEAKAGRTAAPSLFSAIRRISNTLQELYTCEAIVVYGGNEPQTRTDLSLMPWSTVHAREWT
jgi:hypothetical protein